MSYVGSADRTELLDFLRAADVYVLPSTFEPFPVSVLEAMSVGVPVVVTRQCGQAPEIAEYGAGVVIDSKEDANNGELVGRAVLKLLKPDAGEKASRAAWQLVRDRFTVDPVVEDLLGVYESVRKGR